MNSRNWLQSSVECCLSVGITAADWRHITTSLSALNPDTEWLHLDVMDGQFCSKLTCGAWILNSLPPGYIIDAHIMTNSALTQAIDLAKNGAHVVTLQYEAVENALDALLELEPYQVQFNGNTLPLLRGISLCPDTRLDVLNVLLPHVEVIQLLSIDPRTGEKMEHGSFISRLEQLHQQVMQSDRPPLISVDGSMSLELAQASKTQGANIIVSGSALFKNNQLEDNLHLWKQHLYR